ncbi:unnamed protein product [Candidula unifasciata]|uniref:Coiled-coil domain-containing protein R3HCC1L n=1 Tax=Candidula unifasciata TaxID=100452 RepID=A0A8S3ZWC5_9EUPU|nr:unnamed protein product [Candidula unifasciata]
MSNPGSPTPRGRGRGRWKEMSSNERVTNWVNQREAKKLNRERWANHVTGSNSAAGDAGDVQVPTKQEGMEIESSLDRSKAKRQNVPLYVPPSLRAKKESGRKKDPSDFNQDCCAAKGPDIDDKIQNGKIGNSSDVLVRNDSYDSEEQKSVPRETSRSKGRGRGRKKPEVEIYVPRALRGAKHESKCISGTQDCNELKHRNICTEEIQPNTLFADCNIDVNALAPESCTQSPDFSDACISDKVSQDENQHYSNSQSVHHYQAGGSNSPFSHASVTKKGKYETNNSPAVHHYEVDAPASSPDISDEQPQKKSAGKSLTFEFYDPAVVAFLPSTCSVLNSSDINMSYPTDNSRQTPSVPQVSASLQQNVTEFSDSSISCDVHAQRPCIDNDHQGQVSVEKDITHNVLDVCENTKRDSQKRRMLPTDACINKSVPNFSSEQISVRGLLSCQESREEISIGYQNTQENNEQMPTNDLFDTCNTPESSEMLKLPVIDDCSKPVLTVDSAAYLECEAPEEMYKDFKTVSNNADGAEVDFSEKILTVTLLAEKTYPCDSLCQGDLTEYVGKVEIDKPKINYLNYEPKEAAVDYEAFSHILEIYDFSPDLATCDLITSFREFSSRGFDVKWVDDTHALGIFSSAIAAKEALKMIHPLLKVRPLSEASKKGQSKARHCQEFLQPYKARPETTSIAARRLVAGALGMMPLVSKEVRDLERKKLKEAKERRRQERQQKIDMWDGSFKKCAMDEENTDCR